MAFLKTYLQLCGYFEALPTTVTDLKKVVVGADEEVLDMQTAQIQYPIMRVDTPEIRFMDEDDAPKTRYNFRVYVLSNEPKRTNDEANLVLSEMSTLCSKIIKQLYADADADKFDIVEGEKPGDAIRAWSGDNDFGWYFNLVIELYTDECA